MYLVMAVTVKGRTGEKGATTTNRLVNISDFFTQQVWPAPWVAGLLPCSSVSPACSVDADALLPAKGSTAPPCSSGWHCS